MEIINFSNIPETFWRSIESINNMIHFTRIPGCEKETVKLNYANYTYYGITCCLPIFYDYIIIPCNNCNPHHKMSPEECELIPDLHNKIKGIYFRFRTLGKRFYRSYRICEGYNLNNLLLCHYIKHFTISCPKEQFFFSTLVMQNPIQTFCLTNKIEKYYSIFCPVEKKTLTILNKLKEDYIPRAWEHDREFTTSLKFGWNIFYACDYYDNYFPIFKSSNELIPVKCHKFNFKMFILYDLAIIPSLTNLCYSSLLQYNINTPRYINPPSLPPSISAHAPPCHFYHFSIDNARLSSDCRTYPNCSEMKISPHLDHW
jgi:hypothetical protein